MPAATDISDPIVWAQWTEILKLHYTHMTLSISMENCPDYFIISDEGGVPIWMLAFIIMWRCKCCWYVMLDYDNGGCSNSRCQICLNTITWRSATKTICHSSAPDIFLQQGIWPQEDTQHHYSYLNLEPLDPPTQLTFIIVFFLPFRYSFWILNYSHNIAWSVTKR